MLLVLFAMLLFIPARKSMLLMALLSATVCSSVVPPSVGSSVAASIKVGEEVVGEGVGSGNRMILAVYGFLGWLS